MGRRTHLGGWSTFCWSYRKNGTSELAFRSSRDMDHFRGQNIDPQKQHGPHSTFLSAWGVRHFSRFFREVACQTASSLGLLSFITTGRCVPSPRQSL
jgi:hypothetical protein